MMFEMMKNMNLAFRMFAAILFLGPGLYAYRQWSAMNAITSDIEHSSPHRLNLGYSEGAKVIPRGYVSVRARVQNASKQCFMLDVSNDGRMSCETLQALKQQGPHKDSTVDTLWTVTYSYQAPSDHNWHMNTQKVWGDKINFMPQTDIDIVVSVTIPDKSMIM